MTNVTTTFRSGAALVVAILLSACASGPDKPKPTPLETLTPQLNVRALWNQRLDGAPTMQAAVARAGVFTVASVDGNVMALQADSGAVVWRANVGNKLSAGVGTDGRIAAVVTQDRDLVALEAGQVKWRKALDLRVITAPLVAGERVFVLGTDRSVQAYDALDGRKLWTLRRPGDPLTLSLPGALVAYKDTLLVGQGPRLAGLDPLKGTVRWEVPVAVPRGANEIEGLADLLSPMARVGDAVCARAFQSAVGCVNVDRGNLLWSKNIGGATGVAANDDLLVGADASDRLTAWRLASGNVAWTSDKLLNRDLSAPMTVGKVVLFGDLEGQVHWLSVEKGDTLQRVPTDGSAITQAPVVSDKTVLVVTAKGGLYAFRVE